MGTAGGVERQTPSCCDGRTRPGGRHRVCCGGHVVRRSQPVELPIVNDGEMCRHVQCKCHPLSRHCARVSGPRLTRLSPPPPSGGRIQFFTRRRRRRSCRCKRPRDGSGNVREEEGARGRAGLTERRRRRRCRSMPRTFDDLYSTRRSSRRTGRRPRMWPGGGRAVAVTCQHAVVSRTLEVTFESGPPRRALEMAVPPTPGNVEGGTANKYSARGAPCNLQRDGEQAQAPSSLLYF